MRRASVFAAVTLAGCSFATATQHAAPPCSRRPARVDLVASAMVFAAAIVVMATAPRCRDCIDPERSEAWTRAYEAGAISALTIPLLGSSVYGYEVAQVCEREADEQRRRPGVATTSPPR